MLTPNAQQAKNELVKLHDQLMERLAVRRSDPPEHDAALLLAKELHTMLVMFLWCRDASIALARSTSPEVTWDELQEATGVADSTLHSRLRNWRIEETLR